MSYSLETPSYYGWLIKALDLFIHDLPPLHLQQRMPFSIPYHFNYIFLWWRVVIGVLNTTFQFYHGRSNHRKPTTFRWLLHTKRWVGVELTNFSQCETWSLPYNFLQEVWENPLLSCIKHTFFHYRKYYLDLKILWFLYPVFFSC